MRKRALIIGVNGFVGTHLANELYCHGYSVTGCGTEERAAVTDLDDYHACDIFDYGQIFDIVANSTPDCIFNLAAVSSVSPSWRNPLLTFKVNSMGTLNLLEAIRCLGIHKKTRILIVGSSEEYSPSQKSLCEEDELDATNPYGVSKANQERIANLYATQFGLQLVCVRAFNHTGPGQPDTFVLPSFCRQAASIKSGVREPRIVVGNVDVYRDFSDVRDVVRAYRMLLEEDKCIGQVYNVGSGKAWLLRELVELIASFAGNDVAVEVDGALFRPSDNPFIQADVSKIERDLGWRSKRNLNDTLYEMFDLFLGNEITHR